MKTKQAPAIRPTRPAGLTQADIAWLNESAAHWAKVVSWPKAKQRAFLIKLGTITPDGKLIRPKMDHVPYGPGA